MLHLCNDVTLQLQLSKVHLIPALDLAAFLTLENLLIRRPSSLFLLDMTSGRLDR